MNTVDEADMDSSSFPLDSYNFFLVIVTGFVIVWSFRKATKTTDKISDFEYLGLSGFWGMAWIVGLIMFQRGDSEALARMDTLFKEPRVGGLFLALAGGFSAMVLGFTLRHAPDLLDRLFNYLRVRYARIKLRRKNSSSF